MRMLRYPAVAALAIVLAAAVSGPNERQLTDPKSVTAPSSSKAWRVPVEDLFVTRLINSAALSPDGAEVAITTNLTGRTNLWKFSAEGSWPVQFVQSDDRQAEPAWSPDSRWIAFSQDKGGNELYDVYVISRDGGAPVNLTNTPEIREQNPVWSHDGKTIVCIYKPKEAPSFDLALIDIASHKLRKLTEEKDPQWNWSPIGFSPDNAVLYANRGTVGYDDGDVYSIELVSGKQAKLTTHAGKELNIASDVSRDGKTILLMSNRKGGYQNVALLDIATKNLTWVTDTQWEVSAGSFSPDSTRISAQSGLTR